MLKWIKRLFGRKRKPFIDTDPRSNTQRLADFYVLVNGIMYEERQCITEELVRLRERVIELESKEQFYV